jgi:hypothetical protein|tara:strand:- start:1060 stop:1578 length:519 start_codon:yes stop_codon:yes gene_type:complete
MALEFVKEVTNTSATTSVSCTDCFSADYTNYLVVLNVDSLAMEAALEWRVINGSGIVSASEYDHGGYSMRSSDSNPSHLKAINNNKWQYFMYGESTQGGVSVNEVFSPFASDTFTYINTKMQSQYFHTSPTHRDQSRHAFGVYHVAESITGIAVVTTNAAIENCKITVWGYK